MSDPQSTPPEQPPRPRFNRTLIIFLLLPLIFIGSWKGFMMAKLHLALTRAQREFSARQFMRAEFWAGRALSADPRNVEAMRIMAGICEEEENPAALNWRISIAQREPGNTADIMAWAKTALRFNHNESATKALESLPQDFRDHSAEYQELMAGCALADHEPGLAEAYFARAVDLDRENPVHRMNLAAFRLTNLSSPEIRPAALRDLETALEDSRVRLFAVRTLLRNAIRAGDTAKARQYAEKLRSFPEHNFSDDLSALETVMSDPSFHPGLDAVEHHAESDAVWTRQAGDWLNSHGMPGETLRWFAQLPESIRSNARVQMTWAEAYVAVSDWNGLSAFLQVCHWGDGEWLRRAMLVRCERELSLPWEKDWKQLAGEVQSRPPEDLLLARLVIGWNWREEALGLLWSAATKSNTGANALQSLWDIYSRTNDTRDLLRVARMQLAQDPANPIRKNNEAFLSLLLNGPSERAARLAHEASSANPKIAEWASTYAYALHLSGRNSEAKKVMEKLPADALARPGVALYYAIVLAANGDDAGARNALAKLNPSGMLPEEQKMAAGLAQKLGATPRQSSR